jgi:hypothetical protein
MVMLLKSVWFKGIFSDFIVMSFLKMVLICRLYQIYKIKNTTCLNQIRNERGCRSHKTAFFKDQSRTHPNNYKETQLIINRCIIKNCEEGYFDQSLLACQINNVVYS